MLKMLTFLTVLTINLSTAILLRLNYLIVWVEVKRYVKNMEEQLNQGETLEFDERTGRSGSSEGNLLIMLASFYFSYHSWVIKEFW